MQRNGKYDSYLRGKKKAKELLLKKPGVGLKRQNLEEVIVNMFKEQKKRKP